MTMEDYIMTTYRIHGDNIVECERIANLIINEVDPSEINHYLISPSTIAIDLQFEYLSEFYTWRLELLPGFNKSGRRRWQSDIFSSLRDNGSFLAETPDAILTQVEDGEEIILCAIEFCSALQAGNQAWQRSGRAYSTGRTGCPYIYIVDFVKYELDPRSRQRKALRFPNPIVPYSYIYYSQTSENFVAQVYVRSEEFDKNSDARLRSFDESNFGDAELSRYIVKRMCSLDTSEEESILLQKNMNVVAFLAEGANPQNNLTKTDWTYIDGNRANIIEYCVSNASFNFHKTITAKGHHGKSPQMLDIIDRYSIGFGSRDLPFGIIPKNRRAAFGTSLARLYPEYEANTIEQVKANNSDLILCIIKGFKPRGDDNRPDRGILPLVSMLSTPDVEIMTYIYGPVINRNYELLLHSPQRLAEANGFWKSVLALSDFVALDVPIIQPASDAAVLLDTKSLKAHYTDISQANDGTYLHSPLFPSAPTEYHEDDVDTGIHFLFSHLLQDDAFEGMCNPPGGDWSGFSIIDQDKEKRWLSLPRVSDDIDGKRPDHIIELFELFDKPLLLSIESKERSADLEPDVGTRLINYIRALMNYVPNVERNSSSTSSVDWEKSRDRVNFDGFESLSAAAYLKSSAEPNDRVHNNSNCDMLFVMEPKHEGWLFEIIPYTEKAGHLKTYLQNILSSREDDQIEIV